MIEVVIRCVPHGVEEDAFDALRLKIINKVDHPKRPEVANYHVDVLDADGELAGTATLKGFVRDHGLTALVREALTKVPKRIRTWPTAWAPRRISELIEQAVARGKP